MRHTEYRTFDSHLDAQVYINNVKHLLGPNDYIGDPMPKTFNNGNRIFDYYEIEIVTYNEKLSRKEKNK